MTRRKHRYNVFLWEQPHKYTLRADNKEQAERFAVENHKKKTPIQCFSMGTTPQVYIAG